MTRHYCSVNLFNQNKSPSSNLCVTRTTFTSRYALTDQPNSSLVPLGALKRNQSTRPLSTYIYIYSHSLENIEATTMDNVRKHNDVMDAFTFYFIFISKEKKYAVFGVKSIIYFSRAIEVIYYTCKILIQRVNDALAKYSRVYMQYILSFSLA